MAPHTSPGPERGGRSAHTDGGAQQKDHANSIDSHIGISVREPCHHSDCIVVVVNVHVDGLLRRV